MSLEDKLRGGQVTPLDLVQEMLRLYDAEDLAGFYTLLEGYVSYRFYAPASDKERILLNELAKVELDGVAHIADETLALGSPEAAVAAIREGFSAGIGPLRTFYRMAVVYTG